MCVRITPGLDIVLLFIMIICAAARSEFRQTM